MIIPPSHAILHLHVVHLIELVWSFQLKMVSKPNLSPSNFMKLWIGYHFSCLVGYLRIRTSGTKLIWVQCVSCSIVRRNLCEKFIIVNTCYHGTVYRKWDSSKRCRFLKMNIFMILSLWVGDDNIFNFIIGGRGKKKKVALVGLLSFCWYWWHVE